MFREVLKSKLQNVKITESNMGYQGSLTLDEDLIEAAGLAEYEKVHVNNATNGSRIITYVLKGKRGSGCVCMNGGASLHGKEGDEIHVLSYSFIDIGIKNHKPIVVHTDEGNYVKEIIK